ncbi:hypothetical protein Q73_02525 [Bacillus coahuilensis m2-6]|nr:hypothetical protein Q73_02525 [Bacillus coahuilensis m2-6]
MRQLFFIIILEFSHLFILIRLILAAGARLPREIAEKVRPHRACPRTLNRLPRVFTARIKCAAFYEEAHLRPGEWSTFRGNQPGLFNDDHLLKKEEGVPKRLYFWDTLFFS